MILGSKHNYSFVQSYASLQFWSYSHFIVLWFSVYSVLWIRSTDQALLWMVPLPFPLHPHPHTQTNNHHTYPRNSCCFMATAFFGLNYLKDLSNQRLVTSGPDTCKKTNFFFNVETVTVVRVCFFLLSLPTKQRSAVTIWGQERSRGRVSGCATCERKRGVAKGENCPQIVTARIMTSRLAVL